jgi:hypothetical protein
MVEWQRVDSENDLIEPWLTHPFMDWVKNLDLSERVILELGGGASTAWWRKKAKWVDTVEASYNWAVDIREYCKREGVDNGKVFDFRGDLPEGVPELMPRYFDTIPGGVHYDIIINDGIYRTETLEWALNHFKETGGILIADNWQQDYVFISPKAEEIMAPYEIHQFFQPGHTNHEGRPWNTAIWIIPMGK